jgi:hypothetical protein
LFNASPSTTIANPTTANLYMLQNYHSFLSTEEWGGRSRPEDKRFYAVNSKQKSVLNPFLDGSFLTC